VIASRDQIAQPDVHIRPVGPKNIIGRKRTSTFIIESLCVVQSQNTTEAILEISAPRLSKKRHFPSDLSREGQTGESALNKRLHHQIIVLKVKFIPGGLDQ
jgi:hypothetical protein